MLPDQKSQGPQVFLLETPTSVNEEPWAPEQVESQFRGELESEDLLSSASVSCC